MTSRCGGCHDPASATNRASLSRRDKGRGSGALSAIVRLASLSPLAVIAGFLVMLSGCLNASRESVGALYERNLSEGIHGVEAVRGAVRPLVMRQDEDEFACSMCHEGFTGDLTEAALEGAHQNIQFDHGMNLRCLNCHNPANSDTYVNHDGSEIPGDSPTMLCAKCHGPHYREWTLGVHGRINGYWSEQFGEQKKLECVQCHDPHKPRFAPIAPENPPPLTRFHGKRVEIHDDAQ